MAKKKHCRHPRNHCIVVPSFGVQPVLWCRFCGALSDSGRYIESDDVASLTFRREWRHPEAA